MLCIGRNVVDAAVNKRGRVFGEEWESEIAHVDVHVAPSSTSALAAETSARVSQLYRTAGRTNGGRKERMHF